MSLTADLQHEVAQCARCVTASYGALGHERPPGWVELTEYAGYAFLCSEHKAPEAEPWLAQEPELQ